MTLLFSQAEVPLVVDALSMLFQIRDSLKAASLDQPQINNDDDDDNNNNSSITSETPAVIQIAAHAGVLLVGKCMDLTWDCDIYVIAFGNVQFHLSLLFI